MNIDMLADNIANDEDENTKKKDRLKIIRLSKIKNIVAASMMTAVMYLTYEDIQTKPSIIHNIDFCVSSIVTALSYGYVIDKNNQYTKEEKKLVKQLKNK